ncbi:substrate-binding periplasmic protein [Desulfonema ishimotonii]|nr:transporter substrate-binding domain-containing protein [Desulfonema ishimotonii]
MKNIAVVLILMIFSTTTYAQDRIRTIRLVAEEWEEYTGKDGNGLYWDVLRAVYEPAGISIQFDIVPWKRAQEMVRKHKADAIVGEYYRKNATGYLYPDWNIDEDTIVACFKKERFPLWKGEASLSGQKVAWVRGADFNMALDISPDYVEVDTRRSGLSMQSKDRFDIFLDFEEEIRNTAQEMQFDLTPYRMEPIFKDKSYLVFTDSERGRQLRRIYNQRMDKMVESAEVQGIYKKWGWDWSPEKAGR